MTGSFGCPVSARFLFLRSRGASPYRTILLRIVIFLDGFVKPGSLDVGVNHSAQRIIGRLRVFLVDLPIVHLHDFLQLVTLDNLTSESRLHDIRRGEVCHSQQTLIP